MVSWFKSLLAAIALALASQADARVDYAVAFTAPEHHLTQVSIAFPQSNGPFLDVKMPVWRTGRYTLLPLANGVRQFTAADGSGRPLRWEKVDRSTWRIHLPSPSPVRIGYELYGNELGLRSRHIDDSHAFLDASATFMYADRYRSDDITVALQVPQGWTSVSGMQSVGPHRFVAPNWDILVDSPIETGRNKLFRFQEGGRDYEVVFWGEGNYDASQTVADLKKIVAQARTIWSGYPFQRYVFMIHATDGVGGATEHRNSTVIQIPRYNFQPRARYLGFLSTASHEFVHTWNVKAYRPKGLVPYNYDQENYSDLLWVAEGSTSYFEDHLLLRAGIMTPTEFFATLAGAIDRNRSTPGTNVQSVAEASFDQWISTSGDRARNASVDIYSEGSLVSWMLDIALLEQTGGKVSYRDVHDALYRRYKADERGFTSADMLAILAELTGRSWAQWWARHVNSPIGAVDFSRLLNPVGLRVTYEHETPVAWAGWSGEKADTGVRLTSVERGSPAWNAGFTPGDIIVAVNGVKVDKDRLDAVFAGMLPNQTVTVSHFRRDQLGQKSLTLGGSRGAPKVVAVPRPTRAQRTLFQRWLLVPHPSA